MKKPTHGTEAVMEGRLRGATDATDYFYFFCPRCPEDRILRVLSSQFTCDEPGNQYNDHFKRKVARSFIIALEVFCEQCGLHDCIKVSNIGWQHGTHADALKRPQEASPQKHKL